MRLWCQKSTRTSSLTCCRLWSTSSENIDANEMLFLEKQMLTEGIILQSEYSLEVVVPILASKYLWMDRPTLYRKLANKMAYTRRPHIFKRVDIPHDTDRINSMLKTISTDKYVFSWNTLMKEIARYWAPRCSQESFKHIRSWVLTDNRCEKIQSAMLTSVNGLLWVEARHWVPIISGGSGFEVFSRSSHI